MPGVPAGRNGEPSVSVFDRHLLQVASVTVLGTMMAILDTTIVNVALTTLVRSFHTTLATIQWVSTGYLLALAAVIPLTRWAIDRYGAKRAFIVSLSLFVFGSAMCGLSWSIPSLVVFRVVQGLGGGMIMPIGQTILARESGPDRLGRVMTVVGVPQLLGPLLGPVLGGAILSNFSWRWIFLVNIPFGVVALVLARRFLSSSERGVATQIDWRGMMLLPPGLALFVYGISEFGNSGEFNLHIIVSLALGAVLLLGFVYHALHVEQPLLDLRLWKNRGFAASTSVLFLSGGGVNAAVFLVQLYYQIGRGASPFRSGLLVAPAAIGAMIALPISGRIMDRYGSRRIVPFGLLSTAITVVPFTQVTSHTSTALLSALWFARGLGSGMTNTPANAAGYMTLERHEIPGATTINNIAQRVGASLGTAFTAALLQRRIVDVVHGGVQALSKLSNSQRAKDAPEISHAFGFAFWTTVVFAVAALVPSRHLPDSHVAKPEVIVPNDVDPSS
jgi:EmrB/QacA subfamily drug resistance transporter